MSKYFIKEVQYANGLAKGGNRVLWKYGYEVRLVENPTLISKFHKTFEEAEQELERLENKKAHFAE